MQLAAMVSVVAFVMMVMMRTGVMMCWWLRLFAAHCKEPGNCHNSRNKNDIEGDFTKRNFIISFAGGMSRYGEEQKQK